MNGPFLKDPGDRIDFVVDFDAIVPPATVSFLNGDTLTGTPTWTVPDGITNYATLNDTTTATIWLSGGTHGQDYTITCQGTTSGGRIKQQSFVVKVRNDVA